MVEKLDVGVEDLEASCHCINWMTLYLGRVDEVMVEA
jgi:hypothetical protein